VRVRRVRASLYGVADGGQEGAARRDPRDCLAVRRHTLRHRFSRVSASRRERGGEGGDGLVAVTVLRRATEKDVEGKRARASERERERQRSPGDLTVRDRESERNT